MSISKVAYVFKFKGGRRASDCMVGNNGKDDGDLRISDIQIGDVQISDVQIGNARIGDEKPSQMLPSSSSLKIADSEHKSLKMSSNEDYDLLFFSNGS